MPDKVLYESHPAMFRNSPIWFTLCCIGVIAYGLGLLLLIPWWLKCRGTTLTVTDKTTTLRKGILAKSTNEVRHSDVRNVQISQTFSQRLFGVGSIGISSAGQSALEIEVAGMARPDHIRELINQYRD